MIIDCPKCDKKFELDQNLIPINGRMLQCGSCSNTWFFKLKNLNETKKDDILIKESLYPSGEKNSKNEITYEEKKEITKQNNNINYFRIFLALIISFVALIIILDTFKDPLTSVFPNIKIILNNLYQSFEDIKLFLIDLIK